MLNRKVAVRVALACVLALVGSGCTPMLRAAEASKWLNPNKWGGERCRNCVESVPYDPESQASTGVPMESE